MWPYVITSFVFLSFLIEVDFVDMFIYYIYVQEKIHLFDLINYPSTVILYNLMKENYKVI